MGADPDRLGQPDARSAAFRAVKDISFGSVSRVSIHLPNDKGGPVGPKLPFF